MSTRAQMGFVIAAVAFSVWWLWRAISSPDADWFYEGSAGVWASWAG